jgi:glutathione S-transferase
MIIYGDLGSGNCLKVKYTADYLGLPYRWAAVDITKGESRTPEALRRNPMGQVPAIELDDGRCLAQSNAIIRFLARGSALLPDDGFAQAKIDELLSGSSTATSPISRSAASTWSIWGGPRRRASRRGSSAEKPPWI